VRILVDGRILATPTPTGVERSLRTLLLGFERLGVEHVVAVAGRLRTPGRETADVFLSPVTAVPPLGPLPRVATVHDLPWVSGGRATRREWRQRLRLALTRRVARRILVPSVATRDALARVPGAGPPVESVPPGIHPDVLGPADIDAARRAADRLAGLTPPLLLHVGAPRRRKGRRVLLEAFAAVRAVRPASLVLVGPGTERRRVPAGARALGFVDDATLRAIYDRSDVLVHAAAVEGCGLTLLEAMARGTPVVAAAATAVTETAGDAAVLTGPGDALALAEGVLRLLDDAALRDRLVARGRARAADRTPEAQAEGVRRACRDVLEGAR